MKNTELQKRNCEMENSCSEALKNKSVPAKNPSRVDRHEIFSRLTMIKPRGG
jgi:hypothetical protein